MKKWLPAALIAALSVPAPEARADWLNPTEFNDCLPANWPIWRERNAVRDNAHQCFQEHWGTPGNGPGASRHFTCISERPWDRRHEIPACANLEQQLCRLDTELFRRERTCKDRLASYQQRRAALIAQQEEAERLQREQERLAQENGQSLLGQTVLERYGLFAGPARLANDSRLAGERMAQMVGVQMTGNRGAYTLSTAMTRVGNKIIGRLNERALGDLETAFGEFNAANPRPTPSQLEDFYAQRAVLAGRYATHMTRVQNTDYTLPLGDQSAVVGAYAGTIVQLVQMRNAGEIDRPIAALGAAAATFLAARAYREVEERVAEQRGLDVPQAVSPERLRENRQSLLVRLREARARVAPTPPTPRNVPSGESVARDCVLLWSSEGYYKSFKNVCDQNITCSISTPDISDQNLRVQVLAFTPNKSYNWSPRFSPRIDWCRFG